MIFLHRYAVDDDGCLVADIAIVEAPHKAERYEALGFDRCSREALSVAWSFRDAATLAVLARQVEAAAETRDAQAPAQVKPTNGMVVHTV